MQDDQDKMRAKRRDWVRTIKLASGCVRCGYNKHHAALDFHHVRGVKKFTIGWNIFRGYAALKREIKKCEVLCSNCHRIETFQRIMADRLVRSA